MIYPGTYDITVLQNSTWSNTFRATNAAQPVTIDIATATFTAACHGLSANDKVVFTPATTESSLPCGIDSDTVYYVISTGLTTDEFQVSTSLAGASVTLHGTATGTFKVSKPVDLTGYTVDADIKGLNDDSEVATFTTALTDAANGQFELSLSPATALSIPLGRYGYDVSLTSGGGERYYWITGVLTMQRTYSRT